VAEPGTAPISRAPTGLIVAVGNQPEGIAFDSASGVLAVGVRKPDGVLLLDRGGNLLRRAAVSAAPRHLRFATAGGPLLVPAEKAGELDVVDVTSGQVTERVPVGRQPHDVVQADGRYFVTNEFSNSVAVIDPSSGVVGDVPAPGQPGGIAASADAVCVVGVRSHTLHVIDARSLQSGAGVAAGSGPTHVVADAGACYVIDTAGNSLLTFNFRPSLSLAFTTLLMGKPYGVALDPDHRRLWVTETSSNMVAELSLGDSGPRILATYPSVREPNTVAVDGATGRVFVTGAADGVIQILDPPA
jgi:YVTN family beta-propeller protein